MEGCALRRGFKAKAERTSERLRQELHLASHAPLPARAVIRHLGLKICEPNDFIEIPEQMLKTLLGSGNSSWSAVTIEHPNGAFIIQNPTHTPGRQEADLMHEAGHKICDHKPEPMTFTPGFSFALRTYDEQLEQEAKCLGSVLQLPRAALVWAIMRNMSNDDIAEYFTASTEMVRYRRRMSGVDKQLYYVPRTPTKVTVS